MPIAFSAEEYRVQQTESASRDEMFVKGRPPLWRDRGQSLEFLSRNAKPSQIGLQNTTLTIPKSILLLWLGLYNIGSYCIKGS
jgi:hypothetical protein